MSTTPTITGPEQRSVTATRWRIDPSRSSVEFRTRTFWGLSTVRGRFHRYEGTLDLERDPAVELRLDAASLDTGNRLRDEHLRGADFFDTEHSPEVRFVSETAIVDGRRLTVPGRLHAGGRSTPLAVEAALRPAGDELELDSRVRLDHRALGMTHGLLGMIRTPSELIVRGRLVPAAGTSALSKP